MSIDKTVKNVLILMNSEESATSLSNLLTKMEYTPIWVKGIADAEERLKKPDFYAIIFVKSIPKEREGPISNNAGLDYGYKLSKEKPGLKLGYYAGLGSEGDCKYVTNCFYINATKKGTALRNRLRQFLG